MFRRNEGLSSEIKIHVLNEWIDCDSIFALFEANNMIDFSLWSGKSVWTRWGRTDTRRGRRHKLSDHTSHATAILI